MDEHNLKLKCFTTELQNLNLTNHGCQYYQKLEFLGFVSYGLLFVNTTIGVIEAILGVGKLSRGDMGEGIKRNKLWVLFFPWVILSVLRFISSTHA